MNPENPIAVVGMAGLFPGADNLEIFWQNIISRVDATAEVRPERWDVDPDSMVSPEPQPDKAYAKRCCLLTDFDFDPDSSDTDADGGDFPVMAMSDFEVD